MPERMVRRWKQLTEAEVSAITANPSPARYAHGGFSDGPYRPPFCEELVGRSFVFDFDNGESYIYSFSDLHELVMNGKREYCDVLESTVPGVYFIVHLVSGTSPLMCHIIAADTGTGYVTLIKSKIGNEVSAREVSRVFRFGSIRGITTKGEPHHFTTELIGKAIEWKYKNDDFQVKHIYSSEYYYTYAMLKGDGCWMASNPADFVKLRDGLYIFSFLEERQGGTQGLFLMDLEKLHDVACFFGINGEQKLECYTAGAIGRWASPETVFSDRERPL